VHLCLGKVERGINYKANKKGYETEKKKKRINKRKMRERKKSEGTNPN